MTTLLDQYNLLIKSCKFRFNLSQEILNTEKSYVEALENIINVYMIPLKNNKIINDIEINNIFSNFSFIPNVNRKFLTDIEERIKSWPALPNNLITNQDNSIYSGDELINNINQLTYIDSSCCLGDLFEKFGPFFKMYTQYAQNHDMILTSVKNLRENNYKFSSFAEECVFHPLCKGQSLEVF